jgi:hypothetical protein
MMSPELPIESKALLELENYEGANNYILGLQKKFHQNKKFFPTRSQAEYILTNKLTEYFKKSKLTKYFKKSK